MAGEDYDKSRVRAQPGHTEYKGIGYWLKIILCFGYFYDWRIVEAADAQGVRRQCILLPMYQNNIRMARSGPVVTLMARQERNPYNRRIATVFPYVPKDVYERFVAEGLRERSHNYARPVAYIYPPEAYHSTDGAQGRIDREKAGVKLTDKQRMYVKVKPEDYE